MRIFVGAVLACAALVGTARADTYCVSPATGCDHTATSIQNGLTRAASHAGDDTVQLGATTYNLDTDADAGADDLTYPTSGAQGKVTLRGVGPGQTTVTRSLAVTSSEALIGGTLNSTGQLDVSDLKVQLPASQGAAIATLGTVFDDLALVIPDNASTGIVLTASGSALTSTTVTSTLTTTTAGTCVKTSPNSGTTSYTITDVTGTGCTVMLNGPSGTGRTDVERLQVQSPQGINVGSGVHAVIDNSLVRLNAGSTTAILVSVSGSADTTATINQSTVLGPGSSGIGIQAFNNASTTNAPHVNLYDSIVRGFATSLKTVGDATHAASITGDHDSYASAMQATGTTLSVTQSLNDPDPLFTSASDFTLQPLSPLIDNDPTALDPLNEPGVDLAGNIRIVGGKRDLGAYELPALPTASTQAATAIAQTSATIAGAANAGGAAAGGSAVLLYGTTTAYGASMPAHALSRSIGDQPISDAISGLAPGTAYHYALRVTNARGTITSADRAFTTAATPTPPATTSTPAAPEAPTVAAVTKLSLSPTTLRPMTKGALIAVAARGAKLTITLTARAKVTFSVVRRRTGVRVGKSCLAPGHGRHGKACTRTTTVRGTTAKSLAKGTSTLRFSARLGGHALTPGSYALRATPARGKARSTNFRIVR